jgi:prephenate dehydrogenase
VARRPETIEAALAGGLVDRGTTDLVDGVRQADVVVLATPVRMIERQLAEIAPHVKEGCVLMDTGSTKARIVAEMARLPAHVQPLGGHPMCGKEVSGIEAADPALYRGCTFILTPLPRTSAATLELGRELARAIGAQPLVLEPGRQDYLVAYLSHLPYLLACALVSTADATTSADPAAWEIVAGGFRDTSRVAGSDVTMMVDILLTNREAVAEAVEVFQGQLSSLARLLADGDEDDMRVALSRIRELRREMFP